MSNAPPPDSSAAGPQPSDTAAPRSLLCPYCGTLSADRIRCTACKGFFDPLSRQASQNQMGPWFVRDEAHPFRPGCSYQILKDLAARGRIKSESVIRGPTTRQFWKHANRTPGVANLLGECHNCHAAAAASDSRCRTCGASFAPDLDRQHLGLSPVHLLPGQAAPSVVAASALRGPHPNQTPT